MSVIGSIGAAIRQHPIKTLAIVPGVALAVVGLKQIADNPDGGAAGAFGGVSNLRKIPSRIMDMAEHPRELAKTAVESGWHGTGLLGEMLRPS